MEDIFEQIRDRHDKQEKAFQICKAERDKLAEENAALRAKLVMGEDQLFEVNYTMDDLKQELEDKDEMLKRVESDYSQTLAMLVDAQEERDKLKEELEKEKMSQSGLQDKVEKYGDVLEMVETLCKARNIKKENTFGGMEGMEQGNGVFGVVNSGKEVQTIRIVKIRPEANSKGALVVNLTQQSDEGVSGEGLPTLNQELSIPTPVKRPRGRPPKRKKSPDQALPPKAPKCSLNSTARNSRVN